MVNGILFPQFWQIQDSVAWLRWVTGVPVMAADIARSSANGPVLAPTAVLNRIQDTAPAGFQQLLKLHWLFGVQIHDPALAISPTRNQPLQGEERIITAHRFGPIVTRNRRLRARLAELAIMGEDQFFGLVLDRLYPNTLAGDAKIAGEVKALLQIVRVTPYAALVSETADSASESATEPHARTAAAASSTGTASNTGQSQPLPSAKESQSMSARDSSPKTSAATVAHSAGTRDQPAVWSASSNDSQDAQNTNSSARNPNSVLAIYARKHQLQPGPVPTPPVARTAPFTRSDKDQAALTAYARSVEAHEDTAAGTAKDSAVNDTPVAPEENIRTIFNTSADGTILRAFANADMVSVRDISDAKLHGLLKARNIGPKRMARMITILSRWCDRYAHLASAGALRAEIDRFTTEWDDPALQDDHAPLPPDTPAVPLVLPAILTHDDTPVRQAFAGTYNRVFQTVLTRLEVEKVSDLTPAKFDQMMQLHGIGADQQQRFMAILTERAALLEERAAVDRTVPVAIDLIVPLWANNPEAVPAWLADHSLLYPVRSHFALKTDPAVSALFGADRLPVERASQYPAWLQNQIDTLAQQAELPTADTAMWRRALILYLQTDWQMPAAQAEAQVAALTAEQIRENAALLHQVDPRPFAEHLTAFKEQQTTRRELIFDERTLSGATLESIAAPLHITRERVRQEEGKALRYFTQYWRDNRLTLRVLVESQVRPIDWAGRYSKHFSRMIQRLLPNSAPLATLWFGSVDVTPAQRAIVAAAVNQPEEITPAQLTAALTDHGQKLFPAQRQAVLHDLGYTEYPGVILHHTGKLTQGAMLVWLIRRQIGTQPFTADGAFAEQLNTAAHQYFGRTLFTENDRRTRHFSTMIERAITADQIISIGNGHYRLFAPERYDRAVFAQMAAYCRTQFQEGRWVIRDDGLWARFKDLLSPEISADEAYHVFRHFYPDDFRYSNSRSDDIYPLHQAPLTNAEQLRHYLHTHGWRVSTAQFQQVMGWPDYSLSQTVASMPDVVNTGGALQLVDVAAGQRLIGEQLRAYVTAQYQTAGGMFATDLERYVTQQLQPTVDPTGKLFARAHIKDRAALMAVVQAVLPDTEVVNNRLLRPVGSTLTVGALYGRQAAQWAEPRTLTDIHSDFLAQGHSRHQWASSRFRLLNEAGLVPVAENRYFPQNRLPRSPELTAAVTAVLQAHTQAPGYVSVRWLTAADTQVLPALPWPWTPELVWSYGQLLGWRSLAWAHNVFFFFTPLVLVPAETPFTSMVQLAAVVAAEHLTKPEPATALYDFFVALRLMPRKESSSKRVLPKRMLAQGLIVQDDEQMVRRAPNWQDRLRQMGIPVPPE
ncbi:hypothetical protein [Schleiferilactobacillus shenzhenensis]|nr:hypothetical protein [Schleiferilactobacillus shenzhenensis]